MSGGLLCRMRGSLSDITHVMRSVVIEREILWLGNSLSGVVQVRLAPGWPRRSLYTCLSIQLCRE